MSEQLVPSHADNVMSTTDQAVDVAGSGPVADLSLAAVSAAVEPAFRVVEGQTQQRHRTIADTFDWRLFRKGISCEILRSGNAATLAVEMGGTRHEVPMPSGTTLPLMSDALPPGPVRDKLAPILDLRALMPLAEVDETVSSLRVLDSRDKTVVRLAVDSATVSPVGGGAAVELEPHVRLMPVRGYDSAARSVASALDEAGIAASKANDAAAVLACLGMRPGRLPGEIDPAPTPDMPASVAVASVLRSFLDQLEANIPGAIQDIDTEFVHDLRIAVRRSRSALKLAGDVLPEDAAQTFGAELKWLGDVTTPVRDLDVHLLDLPKLASRLDAFSSTDLDAFGEHLTRHREGVVKGMADELSSDRYDRFVTTYRAMLNAVVDGRADLPDSAAGITAGELAAARVARADKRVIKLGRQITPESPAEDLHTLRKRAKELRYVVDLFSPVLNSGHAKALISDLKGLQDVLGAFQDSEVQRDALRAFAAQMLAEESDQHHVPVETLLALGELATHLEVDQRKARAQFEERFEAFVRPSVRKHIEGLVNGAPTTGSGKAATGSGKPKARTAGGPATSKKPSKESPKSATRSGDKAGTRRTAKGKPSKVHAKR